MVDESAMPSFTMSMIPILLPIVLIMISSVGSQFLPKENTLRVLLNFLGDKNIALALGIAASVVCLGKYIPEETRYTPMSDALKTSGTIVFITAAGLVLPMCNDEESVCCAEHSDGVFGTGGGAHSRDSVLGLAVKKHTANSRGSCLAQGYLLNLRGLYVADNVVDKFGWGSAAGIG